MSEKFKNLKLVTHPRSGTHWILKTILSNFQTPYHNYWKMFGGHATLKDIRKKYRNTAIIHASRDIEKVLISVFRMRDRNGLNINNFSEFLRTPYNKMIHFHPGEQCEIIYNGKRNFLIDAGMDKNVLREISHEKYLVQQPKYSWIQNQAMTPPALWLHPNKFWRQHADLNITYENMAKDQTAILDSIAKLVKWPRKDNVYITTPTGWVPMNNKLFDISDDDKNLLHQFRMELG